MGFFDSVKNKAGTLAADAERAGKVTAAQARLTVLQGDLKKAERDLGHAAFLLIERGDLDHPELAPAVERVSAAAAEVRAKERTIAELRGEVPAAVSHETTLTPAASAAGPRSVEPEAVAEPESIAVPEAAPAPAPETAASTVQTAGGPVTIQPAAVMAAAEAEAAFAVEAAAPPRKTTRRKAPAKPAASARKTPAKKAAAKKTPAGKPSKAGSTPKKTSRPSATGPRPAGKKRPADA
jgi:ribonuclease E